MNDHGSEAPDPGGRLPERLSALICELARAPQLAVASSWDRPLSPGTVVGRFELVREVGRGGFGVVYEARDRELGRAVAFKAVRPGRSLDARQEGLLREAEAAARLSHPNIVTLYDVGRSEYGPYLILELLRGQTLAERLAQGPMAPPETLSTAVEVAKGLAHAHANGVVHRDLKPGNVFLCDDGRVKVLDLGMAHAFGRPMIDGGTSGYMAPEQRRGAPEDERTDVFALGVILYEMLAGELPFGDHGRRATPALSLDVPGLGGLGALIASMLEQDPVRRPRNAGEVVALLKPHLKSLERATPTDPVRSVRRRRRLPWRALAVTAGILGGLGAGGWLANRAGLMAIGTVRPAPGGRSVAVLPFADLSPARDQEYFSDGLADEILNALASVDGLRVPGRTSSFFFKGKSVRLADIGRELNVGAVLEGSVRRDGNRVRVTAQLVNVADGYRLWSQAYDRDLTDVLAVQDEIARAVALALDVTLKSGQVAPAGSHGTQSADAFAQYLIGRQAALQMTSDGARRAVQAYEKALTIDPGYAQAWAGLAQAIYFLSDGEESLAASVEARRRALAAAERAVAMAPELPVALATRGYLRACIEHDWQRAIADLERALAINGNDAESHRRYGLVLMALGRVQQATAEMRRALELDPLGPAWIDLGLLLQSVGDLSQAETAYRRHLQIAPENIPSLVGLGRGQLLRSNPGEALATFERCSDAGYRAWGQAAAEHMLGNASASQAALARLVSGHSGAQSFSIAEIHAWRGENDAAFEWLDRALAQREGDLFLLARTDPFLYRLRDDPRFKALLRGLNLPAD